MPWIEPKSNYIASDEVTPEIFNELAENEKHLKAITCDIKIQNAKNEEVTVNSIIFMQVID